jgi:hypothetical protein
MDAVVPLRNQRGELFWLCVQVLIEKRGQTK